MYRQELACAKVARPAALVPKQLVQGHLATGQAHRHQLGIWSYAETGGSGTNSADPMAELYLLCRSQAVLRGTADGTPAIS